MAASAWADGPVCDRNTIPVERRLRQLTLDLLGRPPTMAEYRHFQMKGAVLEEDIEQLMGDEQFFGRMKEYHRAKLLSNINVVVFNNGDTRLSTSNDGARPLEFRGNPARGLRGQQSVGCDHFVAQDACNASRQDPHLEPTTKACRDAMGVPLPVSVDYATDLYQCTALTGATSCPDAITQGMLPAKHLFFCDMRRQAAGALAPFYCLPSQASTTTAALTDEELDTQGRVTAFVNPAGGSLPRLERCTLDLPLTGGVRGRYTVQRGCVQREGHVQVPAPYWMGTGGNVTVCAIEGQSSTVNPWTMEACDARRFTGDRSCGCGADLRRCEPGDQSVHRDRVAAFNEEPLLIADSVLRRDEDYFSMLTTRRGFVNGTLAQFYRQNQGTGMWLVSTPVSRDAVPDVAFDDKNSWVEYTRDESASGVLTTASWLYRFPTQRSRVKQFWEGFLCKSFVPEPGAIAAPPEDNCHRENNLAKRCGCSYCHASIEPTGAHWGRYGERNAEFLDPQTYPRFSAKCRDCALAGNTTCDNECSNYIMRAYDGDGAASLGLLNGYLYRTPDEEPNIAAGPKLLVERMLQTGDLERCTVQNIWQEFLGRPMTPDEQKLYLKDLASEFAANGHSLKALIQRVVNTDAYRRID